MIRHSPSWCRLKKRVAMSKVTKKKSKVSPNKGSKNNGRPTRYNKQYDEQARKLCLMGYTDAQLADFFEVTETSINNWKIKHKTFFESLKAGKVMADANVTASLYEKAIGYSCKDTKFATHEGEITDEKEYTKNYPPCPISIKYWLNNRQPKIWREKVEVDENKSDAQPLTINFEVAPAVKDIKITNADS